MIVGGDLLGTYGGVERRLRRQGERERARERGGER